MRNYKVAGAAMLAVAALAGCSSSVGPLGGPGTPGQLCSPLRAGQVLSYGLTALRNSGNVPVVINRVGLVDARGLRVLAAYIVPGTSNFGYGTWVGYPPAHPLPPGVDWSARERAKGAVLRPMKKSQQDSLLLVIKSTVYRGRAKAVGIWYSAGGSQYYLQPSTSLVTVDRSSCP